MAGRIYTGAFLGGPADGGHYSSTTPTVEVPVFLVGGEGELISNRRMVMAVYKWSERYGVFIEEDVTDPAAAAREGEKSTKPFAGWDRDMVRTGGERKPDEESYPITMNTLRGIVKAVTGVGAEFVKQGLTANVGESTAATFRRWLTDYMSARKKIAELERAQRVDLAPITKTSDSRIMADLQRRIVSDNRRTSDMVMSLWRAVTPEKLFPILDETKTTYVESLEVPFRDVLQEVRRLVNENGETRREIWSHNYPFLNPGVPTPLYRMVDMAIDTERERADDRCAVLVARLLRVVKDLPLPSDRQADVEKVFVMCLEQIQKFQALNKSYVEGVDKAVLAMQNDREYRRDAIQEVRGVLQAHGYPSDGKPLESLVDTALRMERSKGGAETKVAFEQNSRAATLEAFRQALLAAPMPLYNGTFTEHLDRMQALLLEHITAMTGRVGETVRQAVAAKGEECAKLRRKLAEIQGVLEDQCRAIENEL